jgi:putative membrane-bound dehydrogenase-like protein
VRKIRLFLVIGSAVLAAGAAWVFLYDSPPAREIPRGLEALRVPEGFTVEMVAGPELVSYPMFAALDDAGRLYLCESSGKALTDEEMTANPQYRVSVLEDRDDDGTFDKSGVFADRLTISQGAVWHRGSLYVASPPDFYRFEDRDGDGASDVREVILSGFPMKSNAATLHGPFLGPDGWLYLAHGNSKPFRIETPEGKVVEGRGSRIWRTRPDGTGLEWITAGGHDNPVEVVFTPSGEPFATSTYFQNPKGGLRDAIFHLVEGGIYPKYTRVVEQFRRTGDLMPVMTRMGRVSPAGLIRYESGAFGQEYRGNLFSAQFNPHRVQRHRLTREGATFRTEDEDLLTSLDPEVHFTDLVEDVDGSLLVVDTGAWFIKGCPVSRVSRPEFKGAIYRVRKLNAHKVDDPRGRRLNLDQQNPPNLVNHLEDERVFVRKRALDLLVEAGTAGVAPLSQILGASKSPEVRCAAVFGLYRIGSPEALETCRRALQDPDLTVRIAAARVLGMVRDRKSVEMLMTLAQKDEAPVRRQAATALGQIGARRAVPALLLAAADPSDRMVEHSIIFSLISLKQTPPLIAGLKSSSPAVQKAALIALDQMEGRPLRKEHLLTFLAGPESELSEAALWVAGHHPEWAADAVEFLRPRLAAGPSADDREALARIFTPFSGNPKVQGIITEALAVGTPSQKIFLLDVIDRSPVKELPAAWLDQLRRRLQDPEDGVRARCTDLIKTHKLSGFETELETIAANPGESDDLRVAAMDALVGSHPTLSREHFDFLSARLNTATPAPLRLAAGRVIGRVRLDDTQLLDLARKELSQADPLVFPNLLDAFASKQSPKVSRALLDALLKNPEALDSYARARVDEIFKNFPEDLRQETQVLTRRLHEIKQARIERLMKLDHQLREGNVEKGRKLFFGQLAGCSSCHTIGAEGHEVGPDLTSVGAVRSRHDLLEAIIFPSASFVPGHEVRRVQTKRERHSGILGGWERAAAVDSDSDVLILVTGPNARVRIPRSEIVSMEASPVSLMPEGLGEALSRDQLADILAFLQAQKQLSDQSLGATPEPD